MKSDKIVSMWDIPVDELDRKFVCRMIQSKKNLISYMTMVIAKRYRDISYKEIYSYVMEYFYKAMRAYRPDKGSFIPYAYFYVYARASSKIKSHRKFESRYISSDMEYFTYSEPTIDQQILIKKSLSALSSKEKEIIESYAYKVPIKVVMKKMKIKTRYEYRKIFEGAIEKMRKCVL